MAGLSKVKGSGLATGAATASLVGIDDNATSTAITIDASEKSTFNGKVKVNNSDSLSWSGTSDAGVLVGSTSGSSLLVRTPSLNTSYNSGFAIDGSYTSGTSKSQINLKALGVKSGGNYHSDMAFYTTEGATVNERMRISSAGNVTVKTGNLVIGTSGKGIDFSATSDGSGTMTSEVLDDYEEGVHLFTAVGSTSGSWTPRNGWHRMAYTKIGRQVTVTGQIEIQGSSSPIGDCRISLPFAVGSTDARFSGRTTLGDIRGAGTTSGHIVADATNSNAYLRLAQVTDAGSLTFLNESRLDASWEFNLSLTYFTD